MSFGPFKYMTEYALGLTWPTKLATGVQKQGAAKRNASNNQTSA